MMTIWVGGLSDKQTDPQRRTSSLEAEEGVWTFPRAGFQGVFLISEEMFWFVSSCLPDGGLPWGAGALGRGNDCG